MSDRTFAFAAGAAVAVRHSAIVGKVLARAAEPDQTRMVEVNPENVDRFEGANLGDVVPVTHEVNAYQVAFEGDNGRPDTAWWLEDMLELAA